MHTSRVASSLPDVFSVDELALATGQPFADVQAWVEAGAIRALPVGDGLTWIARGEALRAGRALLDGTVASTVGARPTGDEAALFTPRRAPSRATLRGPLALSGGLHVALLGAIVLVTTLGLAQATATTEAPVEPEPLRLVYLVSPGPGGGGGGGGVKAPVPAPKAERHGTNRLDSPVPVKLSPIFGDPPPRPAPKPDPLPEVVAPVVQVAANREDRVGVVEPSASTADSRGQGDAGGVGTGAGSGVGQGEGAGIGEGEGGGTGGGVYRPGSGVLPPSLLREVKPDYTEDARRRGITGEVLMEIVVRRDGTVGDVKVLSGLGYGLDERAIAAVRQWKFSPATLHGKAVDVAVEVSMEFRLR